MNPLEEYDRKHERDCIDCSNHVTRNNGELHFCKSSGKILLYPLYLPSKCEKWKERSRMNKTICIAKKAGIVAERGKASIEWYKDGEPQYYCYGYKDKMTDDLLDVCRNCKDNVIYAQDDMDKHKREGKDE